MICENGNVGLPRQVTVWLDELAPARGTFAHALEWAALLNLRLHGVISTEQRMPSVDAEAIAACKAICGRFNVAWSCSYEAAGSAHAMDEPPRANQLCVLGGAIPMPQQRRLVREALARTHAGPLVCPRAWGTLRRALVINAGNASQRFLSSAARICCEAAAQSSVLTLASSEEDAMCGQEQAIRAFADERVKADFQYVVCDNLRTAVMVIGRWRRCSHVFMEKKTDPWFRRWLGTDLIEYILELSETFAVLAIPSAGFSWEVTSRADGAGVPAGIESTDPMESISENLRHTSAR